MIDIKAAVSSCFLMKLLLLGPLPRSTTAQTLYTSESCGGKLEKGDSLVTCGRDHVADKEAYLKSARGSFHRACDARSSAVEGRAAAIAYLSGRDRAQEVNNAAQVECIPSFGDQLSTNVHQRHAVNIYRLSRRREAQA